MKPKVFKIRVITKELAEVEMVRAKSEAKAIAHIVRKHIETTEASPEDLVSHGAQGGVIEEAVE